MAAKTDETPPSKLSPSERLARKRAAARLRQQRCRARKRQALLQQRRQENDVRQGANQDSRVQVPPERSASHNSAFPTSRSKETLSSSSEPIYTCVSFDSQRSYEEAQRSQQAQPSKSPKEQSPKTITSPQSSSPPRKPVEVVSCADDQSDGSLVSEEEAAVAAMLSLKSGSKSPASTVSTESEPKERLTIARATPRAPKYRYYRSWDPRHYEAFDYARHGPYYGMHIPHRAVPPQYRYYPTFKGYARYDYE